jgi:hypothetical protein
VSIYCSDWSIQIEDDDHGGSFEGAWLEVYCQVVPNHINEQNGYGGPHWDEWLPAFIHKPDCTMRTTTYHVRPTDHAMIVEHCDAGDTGAEPRKYHDCECGPRAVFLCDDLTTKGTARNGQEYVNPVLVLTWPEYEAATFSDLLDRITESVAERRGRPQCMEPGCTLTAVHTSIRKREIVQAWCETHDVSKLWRGQQKRRRQAARIAENGAPT